MTRNRSWLSGLAAGNTNTDNANIAFRHIRGSLLYITSQDLEHSSHVKQAAELCFGKGKDFPEGVHRHTAPKAAACSKRAQQTRNLNPQHSGQHSPDQSYWFTSSPMKGKWKVIHLEGFLKAWDGSGWVRGFLCGPWAHQVHTQQQSSELTTWLIIKSKHHVDTISYVQTEDRCT